jgi:hypothetical protein
MIRHTELLHRRVLRFAGVTKLEEGERDMERKKSTHQAHSHGNTILSCLILSTLILTTDRAIAQIDTAAYWNTLPRPVLGWNSLQRRFIFPELAQRSGLRGAYLATVTVDANGGVTEVSVTDFDGKPVTEAPGGTVVEPVINSIKTVRWTPGTDGGKPINSRITLPIIFATRGHSTGPAFLITAVHPQIYRNSRGTDWRWTRTSDGACTAAINRSELKIGQPPKYYCDTSFSSDDPERSYDIREAKWTWNSQLLVLSMSRNWNREQPILVDVYSRRTNRIYSLDALIGPVASSHVRLIGDESVELHLKPALGCNDSVVTFNLEHFISRMLNKNR